METWDDVRLQVSSVACFVGIGRCRTEEHAAVVVEPAEVWTMLQLNEVVIEHIHTVILTESLWEHADRSCRRHELDATEAHLALKLWRAGFDDVLLLVFEDVQELAVLRESDQSYYLRE